MIVFIVMIPCMAALLWLLSIRPYCRRHGKGYTPGANAGVTFWVDWQEAKEISKSEGDHGMIMVCRVMFWLHIVFFSIVIGSVFLP